MAAVEYPICREPFTAAHETPCRHKFCFNCIQQHLQSSATCPYRGCGAFLTVEMLRQPYSGPEVERSVRKRQRQPDSPQSSKSSPAPRDSLGGQDSAATSATGIPPNMAAMIQELSPEQRRELNRLLKMEIKQDAKRADNEMILNFMERIKDTRVQQLRKLQQEIDTLNSDIRILAQRRGTTSSDQVVPMSEAVKKRFQRVEQNMDDFEKLWLESLEQTDRRSSLDRFSVHMNNFTKFSALEMQASWRHSRRNDGEQSSCSGGGNTIGFPNIVSSIELDMESERLATAGVLKQIKIFEIKNLMRKMHVHLPVQDMSTNSKLSSLSWNKYIGHFLISSDYDGVVTLWDTNRGTIVREYMEHEGKIWSVDFSKREGHTFASGSDDAKVKIWHALQEGSTMTIPNQETRAQVCCVKFSPESTPKIVFGCADFSVLCYDLRYPRQPLYTLRGHDGAVSYVSFMKADRLVTASTDSTLKLWDVGSGSEQPVVRRFVGHRNQKNFVGLSVTEDYIACGSEDNKVYTYYSGISNPCVTYPFDSLEGGSGDDNEVSSGAHRLFVSAVSWCPNEPILFAANSQGNVRMLKMV